MFRPSPFLFIVEAVQEKKLMGKSQNSKCSVPNIAASFNSSLGCHFFEGIDKFTPRRQSSNWLYIIYGTQSSSSDHGLMFRRLSNDTCNPGLSNWPAERHCLVLPLIVLVLHWRMLRPAGCCRRFTAGRCSPPRWLPTFRHLK